MMDSGRQERPSHSKQSTDRRSEMRLGDNLHCFGESMQSANSPLSSSPMKSQPILVSLKLDHRDFQPSEAIRTNRNAHTPTEKINTFTGSPQYTAGTPPSTA